MGKGDNRRTRKMLQHKSRRKFKARLRKKMELAKAKK